MFATKNIDTVYPGRQQQGWAWKRQVSGAFQQGSKNVFENYIPDRSNILVNKMYEGKQG